MVIFDDEKFPGRPCKDSTVPNLARDGDMAAYQDMSPVHLCSTKSVEDLNTRLTKKIQIYNFRPNIIVENADKPYAEVCDVSFGMNRKNHVLFFSEGLLA